MRGWRTSVWLAAAALSLVATGAQAASCAALKRELSGGGGFAKARFDRAIDRQAAQIAKARGTMRRLGCAPGSRLGDCGRFGTAMNDMRANLKSLKRTRERLGGRSRKAIRREMKRRGCDTRFRAERRTLDRQVHGRSKANRPSAVRKSVAATSPPPTSRGTTFKTMCVRSCDGLAVPVSMSTTVARFGQDAAACSAMCPGTEVNLFAMPVGSEDLSAAIGTTTGEPYTALPRAFAHQKAFDAACACSFQQSPALEEALLRPIEPQRMAEAIPGYSAVTVPTLKPDLRPDTPVPVAVERERVERERSGEIRIVGESFLPVR